MERRTTIIYWKEYITSSKIVLTIAVFICFGLIFLSCSSVDYYSHINHNHNGVNKGKTEISLLTYNIKAIYEKNESDLDKLMDFVNGDKFDFIVFQELFDESTRDYIIEKSDSNWFITIISRIDYNSFPEFLFQDAGLFMMSRFPRIDLSPIDFGDDINNSNGIIHMILEKEYSRTNDFLANKSVMGSLFTINDSDYVFLFTAHVQAAGTTEHKEFQLGQIKDFIYTAIENVISNNLIKDPQNLIVILAGDFNSNAYSKDRFDRLITLLGHPRDLHKEFNGNAEEYTFRDSRRFDYIFSYDKIAEITLKKVEVQSMGIEDMKDNNNISISDHSGLKAILSIE